MSGVRFPSAIFARWGIGALALMLFFFLAASASQAHERKGNLNQPAAGSAAQMTARPVAADPFVARVVVTNASIAIGGADDCDGSCCPCPCCAPCSAVMAADGVSLPIDGSLERAAIPLARAHLPSAELDALFRPPRLRA